MLPQILTISIRSYKVPLLFEESVQASTVDVLQNDCIDYPWRHVCWVMRFFLWLGE